MVQAPEEPPKDPVLEAFETQYAAAQADPSDFSKWVALLSTSEKLVRPLYGRLCCSAVVFQPAPFLLLPVKHAKDAHETQAVCSTDLRACCGKPVVAV